MGPEFSGSSLRAAYAGARWLAMSVLAIGALAACAPEPDSHADAAAQAEADANHPGRLVYQEWCASCHDDGANSGAPSLEALRTLNQATIRYALELGYMKMQAAQVPKDDLKQVIDWLPREEGASDAWIEAARCPIKQRIVRLEGAPRSATTFGLGPMNQRRESAEQAGLTKADMPKLELAWAVAFPNTPTMRSQPVVVGDTLFIATTDAARLYALDADTGCVKWMYRSDMTLRSSLSFGEATATTPAAILMGDAAGRVHAVAAETGKELWVTDVKLNDLNRITGAPVVHDGVVYAPISAIEVNFAQFDDYECCKGQGAVAAVDLATGKKLWTGRTMPEATPQRIGRTGTQQWGPSGAIIWSTPAVDAKRGVLYAGTGESVSWPATDTSDAIIAYDLKTGDRRWSFQATKADIWNYACGRGTANCDFPGDYHSPDFDFGGSALIAQRADGSDLVVAGQKSGVVWALDPDRNGALVWANRIGRGSASGGVHWGIAFDGKRIFATVNDRPAPTGHPLWGPGVHALDVETGRVLWSYKPTDFDCGAETPPGRATRPAPGLDMLAMKGPIEPISRAEWNSWSPMDLSEAQKAAATAVPTQVVESSSLPPLQTAPPVAPVAQPAAAAGQTPPQPRRPCRNGYSPAPLVVDGAVVTGNLSGMLRIFDGETGEELFAYQTNREFPDTVNGLPGHGGSLDSHPYVAANGALYVQSGYSRFAESPGNVLLAFRPAK
ncbi:MAG: PQQ-binding-like beta-propeller repeat protein [Hyphomonadaceae bacterium]